MTVARDGDADEDDRAKTGEHLRLMTIAAQFRLLNIWALPGLVARARCQEAAALLAFRLV